eukprot:3313682-Prymnesium_polylepis.1
MREGARTSARPFVATRIGGTHARTSGARTQGQAGLARRQALALARRQAFPRIRRDVRGSHTHRYRSRFR